MTPATWLLLAAFAGTLRWAWVHLKRHQERERAAQVERIARAVGVLVEQDPAKVEATREALRQEALVLAHVRRDLTDERLAAWLEGAL